MVTENFSNLRNNINVEIQETEKTPNRVLKEIHTKYIIIKFLKSKEKGENLGIYSETKNVWLIREYQFEMHSVSHLKAWKPEVAQYFSSIQKNLSTKISISNENVL